MKIRQLLFQMIVYFPHESLLMLKAHLESKKRISLQTQLFDFFQLWVCIFYMSHLLNSSAQNKDVIIFKNICLDRSLKELTPFVLKELTLFCFMKR